MYMLKMASGSIDQIAKRKSQRLKQTNAILHKTNERKISMQNHREM